MAAVFAVFMLLGIATVQPVSAQAPTPLTDPVTGLMVPDYFGVANWAYSPGLTKFVDKLPGLGSTSANLLGQYIPVAVADTTTYPGADYYEIAVVEYKEQLHSELPATTLRGYVQISTAAVPGAHVALSNPDGSPINMPNGTRAYGVTPPHYLGPVIVATGALKGVGGKPVRIRFFNLLPTGPAGGLFVPVDTTIMGAGMGLLPIHHTPRTGQQSITTATMASGSAMGQHTSGLLLPVKRHPMSRVTLFSSCLICGIIRLPVLSSLQGHPGRPMTLDPVQ